MYGTKDGGSARHSRLIKSAIHNTQHATDTWPFDKQQNQTHFKMLTYVLLCIAYVRGCICVIMCDNVCCVVRPWKHRSTIQQSKSYIHNGCRAALELADMQRCHRHTQTNKSDVKTVTIKRQQQQAKLK